MTNRVPDTPNLSQTLKTGRVGTGSKTDEMYHKTHGYTVSSEHLRIMPATYLASNFIKHSRAQTRKNGGYHTRDGDLNLEQMRDTGRIVSSSLIMYM